MRLALARKSREEMPSHEERITAMRQGYRLLSLGALAVALAVAGCQSSVAPPRGAGLQPSGGVEGDWVDSDGVYIARFAGGTFVSVATDTGNRLAEGTYQRRDAQTIEITMLSLIRQQQTSVNCALVSPTQLNCTNSAGQNFVLLRRTGVS